MDGNAACSLGLLGLSYICYEYEWIVTVESVYLEWTRMGNLTANDA